jgi:hypothetical protein
MIVHDRTRLTGRLSPELVHCTGITSLTWSYAPGLGLPSPHSVAMRFSPARRLTTSGPRNPEHVGGIGAAGRDYVQDERYIARSTGMCGAIVSVSHDISMCGAIVSVSHDISMCGAIVSVSHDISMCGAIISVSHDIPMRGAIVHDRHNSRPAAPIPPTGAPAAYCSWIYRACRKVIVECFSLTPLQYCE